MEAINWGGCHNKKCQRLNKLCDLLFGVILVSWCQNVNRRWGARFEHKLSLNQKFKRTTHGSLQARALTLLTSCTCTFKILEKVSWSSPVKEFILAVCWSFTRIQIPLIFLGSICSQKRRCCLVGRSCFHTLGNCIGLLSETDGELLEEIQFKRFTT